MATIEVDEGEFNKRQAAWDLLDGMLKNPKTRAKAREAIKELRPETSFAEDVAEPLLKPLNDKIEALENMLKKERDDKSENDLKSSIENLKKNHGFTDEGIDEVVKLMKDRNIGDPEVAAVYIKSQQKAPVEIQGFQPSGWQIEGQAKEDENVKALFGDPEAWADREAAKVINELRAGKVA